MSRLPLLFLAFLPIAGFLAYRSYKQEQKRREQLLAWCTASGYTFTVEDERWCQRWSTAPFGQGDHRRANNVITGRVHERTFAAFDYTYQTHSTDGRGNRTTTTHRYLVTTLQLPAYLPSLQVTPESVFTRIGNVLGLDDIELESEDFNRRFRVHAQDRKFATDVLSPRTMQALLERPSLSRRIDGVDLLSWQDGKLSPAAMLSSIAALETVVAGIPSFVWKDHS